MIKLTLNILPLLFKVSEKSIFKQQFVLDKKLYGFRKAHSTQQALFRLLQLRQKQLDNCGCVCTKIMNPSKAYDCIPQDLLIAKLKEHRLDKTTLSFLLGYLGRKGKRSKIGSVYSEWVKILSGIPQAYVLGPLLFNIFINDWSFFAFKSEICNYADDKAPHFCGQVLQTILCNFKYNLHDTLKY